MTLAAMRVAVDDDDEIDLDDADIHARAWAMVERVCDSIPDRIVLLHAAAMLKAVLAVNQPDPTAALGALLGDHCRSAGDILRQALALAGEETSS
ncbi:hypothetical protein ACEYYA_02450 [Paracoccus sp. p3-h83]|uniref:hypothetical protein n=1 Tax=Paracoccus sp. p3-h83 TaxID=3342805 RepID=UPI0035B7D851